MTQSTFVAPVLKFLPTRRRRVGQFRTYATKTYVCHEAYTTFSAISNYNERKKRREKVVPNG